MTTHTSRVATDWLQKNTSDFKHFQWPYKCSDRNINEHIRNALQRAVRNRTPSLLIPMDFCAALQDSWRESSPRYLQTFLESMLHPVAALLCAYGGIHYTILGRCNNFSGT